MSLTPQHDHNQPPAYSVSDISGLVKKTMEDNFDYVRVRGELSKVSRPRSGHIYVDLKDEKSVLAAVCWKGQAAKLSVQPEMGVEVIATGRISTFAGQSKYQLIIDQLEIAGEGALMALLEKRKKQLAAEGLFDAARKQPLPFLPRTIAIVTSPTGAVIRDMVHRITERFPAHVLLWPVKVQGDGAKEEITAAIEGFNAIPEGAPHRPDLLIVARGGGSIEDLWAFNEDNVVRAAAASRIPLISAVGHETDTTLIDYVSDKRAPTPTGAAELAVPVRADLVYTVGDYANRQVRAIQNQLNKQSQLLEALGRGLTNPARLLENAVQRLDTASERLRNSLPLFLTAKQQALSVLVARIRPQLLGQQVTSMWDKLTDRTSRLTQAFTMRLTRAEDRVQNLARVLSTLSHESVLARGFAVVRASDGQVVTRAEAAQQHDLLEVQFVDDTVRVSRQGALPKPVKQHRKPSAKQPPADDQGNLF